MKIPVRQHRLQRDPTEILSSILRLNGSLCGDNVLYALEHAVGHPLPADLRTRVSALADPTSNKRGRPALQPHQRAVQEFAMEELDEKYRLLLANFANDKTNADGQPSSERAYRKLADDMRQYFGPMDWRSLQNKHSAWRNGGLHTSAKEVDSADFDAEIDRQFPRTQNRSEFE